MPASMPTPASEFEPESKPSPASEAEAEPEPESERHFSFPAKAALTTHPLFLPAPTLHPSLLLPQVCLHLPDAAGFRRRVHRLHIARLPQVRAPSLAATQVTAPSPYFDPSDSTIPTVPRPPTFLARRRSRFCGVGPVWAQQQGYAGLRLATPERSVMVDMRGPSPSANHSLAPSACPISRMSANRIAASNP